MVRSLRLGRIHARKRCLSEFACTPRSSRSAAKTTPPHQRSQTFQHGCQTGQADPQQRVREQACARVEVVSVGIAGGAGHPRLVASGKGQFPSSRYDGKSSWGIISAWDGNMSMVQHSAHGDVLSRSCRVSQGICFLSLCNVCMFILALFPSRPLGKKRNTLVYSSVAIFHTNVIQ